MGFTSIPLLLLLAGTCNAQIGMMGMGGPSPNVKITEQPFQVSNAQHLNQIVWTMIGNTIKESIYCVSEAPVSQLRFVCVDCEAKNVTDMVPALNSAQDLTRSAGFPTVVLKLTSVNVNWTGLTIACQAAVGGGTIDSPGAVVDVRYLKQPHVVDASDKGPVLIPNQGYRFYVECVRGQDGQCQQSARRKTLKCAVQAHPPATTYRWLKNGVVMGSSGAEISIGNEMIGQSLQCTTNNGMYSDMEMPTSQAVQIDPYSAARVVEDNFRTVQTTVPFQPGNRIEMGREVRVECTMEGNPKPIVYWKLRRANGEVVDAPCPQGPDAVVEASGAPYQLLISGSAKYKSSCTMRMSNYSLTGTYWCSACSIVSQGDPECSPSLTAPSDRVLNVIVQGPPMKSEMPISYDPILGSNNAMVSVHYCADPPPRPPREIVFSIDQNDILAGQRWESFHFESNVQNSTVNNCYIARLMIGPVREEDKFRNIQLKVTNQYGTKMIPVSLEAVDDRNTVSGRLSGWWIAVIVVIASMAALICLTIVCMKARLCCFNATKKKTRDTDYSDTAKTNLNVRSTMYRDDVPPRLYQQPPSSAESGYDSGAYDAAVYAALYGGDGRISSV